MGEQDRDLELRAGLTVATAEPAREVQRPRIRLLGVEEPHEAFEHVPIARRLVEDLFVGGCSPLDVAAGLEVPRQLAQRVGPPAAAEIAAQEQVLVHADRAADGARAAIKRCLRRDRSAGAAWAMLGQLEAERGKGARALAAWKRGAVADEEAAAGLYPKIAAGYAAQGRPETFEEFLQTILQDRPFDHAARIALARNRASHGQTKRAIEELSRAIEVAPHDLALRVELGRQLLASGQEGEALKGYADLLEALERGPAPDADGEATGDTEADA